MTLTVLAAISLSLPLVFGEETKASPDQDKSDDFWNSVYEDNHVVEIDISLTKEAWESMQPAQNERGRGGPPRGGVLPDGPPQGRSRRPDGPLSGGGPSDRRGPSGPPPGGGGGRGGAGTSFEYVKADITIDGEQFKDAGLRFKGNSSYRFSSDGLKRPLKIDTNRFVTEQKLHGRTKFNLSNSYLDPAFMKEKLAYEVYQAAGIPTPGTGWAKVSLSIEDELKKKNLGIYVLIEQVDENYLERKFGEKSKDSLLMKPETHANWQHPGEEIEQYKEVFNIKEGEDNKEQITQFGDFLRLIGKVSGTEFSNQIGEKMDLDFYAGYLAATSLLASLDSYIGAPHNYYLMVDQADNKVRLFPWDVNEAFGTFTMGTTPEKLAEWDITRPWTSNIPLLERLFTHKDFSKLYQEKLNKLMKGPFTEKHLYERVDIFTKTLKPYLSKTEQIAFRMGIEGDSSGKNSAVERDIFAIKPFIKRRIRSVKAQLAGKSKGVKIEGRGGRGGRGGRPPRRQAPREESRAPKD